LFPAEDDRYQLGRLAIGARVPPTDVRAPSSTVFLRQAGDAAVADDFENRPIEIDRREAEQIADSFSVGRKPNKVAGIVIEYQYLNRNSDV
jgi:hypothetical protein